MSVVFCSLCMRDKKARRFVVLDLLGIGCENDAIIFVHHSRRVLMHNIPSRPILLPWKFLRMKNVYMNVNLQTVIIEQL